MTHSTLKRTFAFIIENVINKSLAYDSTTQERIKTLTGKIFFIQCISPSFEFYIQINKINSEEKESSSIEKKIVSIFYALEHTSDNKKPDITITGTLQDMLSLSNKDNVTLADSNVNIAGNVLLLNELQSILKSLDIDWEAPIVEIFGPTVGHQVAKTLFNSTAFIKRQSINLPLHFQQFITDEIQLVPDKTQVENFISKVAQIKKDTERLEAKITTLKHLQLNKKTL